MSTMVIGDYADIPAIAQFQSVYLQCPGAFVQAEAVQENHGVGGGRTSMFTNRQLDVVPCENGGVNAHFLCLRSTPLWYTVKSN